MPDAVFEVKKKKKRSSPHKINEKKNWKKKNKKKIYSNPLLPFTPNSPKVSDDGGGVGCWSYYLRMASPP